MSIVEHRSVIALIAQARDGLARRTLVRMVAAALIAATLVGWRTADAIGARDASLVQLDHRVTATLTGVQTHLSGRSASRTVVATWEFPAGLTHSEVISTAWGDSSTTQTLWVDDSGVRVEGSDGGLSVTGAVVVTLLLCGLTATAAAFGVPAWRRYRLRKTVDARWRELTHQWWEDL
jgi:hypothetical protein